MREGCKVSVLGGDLRFKFTADYLRKAGVTVDFLQTADNLYNTLSGSGVVVLPLPLSRDGKNLNAPLLDANISLLKIFSLIPQNSKVFAGMISEDKKKLFEERGLEYYDYYDSEKLILENALITAEGIIQTAMKKMTTTINGSSFGISGFGRVGKLLAERLKLLGGNVTIAARNPKERQWAEIEGCKSISFNELSQAAKNFDCFINTVPVQVISDEDIKNFKEKCLLIETASNPGGFPETAENVIKTGSLPGKTSPETAGVIIGEVILDLLKGEP